MKRMNAAMILAMLASTGASVELASDMAIDRDAFKRAASEPMSIPFRSGRAASSLAALDFWSRQRLRARQTHPGKRGRMTCTAEHHAHLVAHEWHRLIPIGSMAGVESANCPDCPEGERFTFSRTLPVSRFWLCKRDHVVRVEHSDGHMTVYNLQDGCIPDLDDEEFAKAVWAAWDGDGDERYQGTDASEAKAWDACERHNESQEAA